MDNLTEMLKNLGPARIAVLGATFVSLVIFFIFVSAKVSQPPMSVLYRDLETADSAQISAKLEETAIPYSISADGAMVYVPQNEIGRARMLLAEAGLPNGGSMGYEIFDQQSGFGTTSFVQNINQVRALQGELARTISALDPVQYAKVHIVLPQRELFSRETQEASASVTLKLKGAQRLTRQQIYGIQNLVANAIPGLNADNVTIVDTQANMLAGGNADDPETMMGLKAEEMRRSYEQRMVSAIENLVGRTVGFDKVRATVTADLDFDRIVTNDEIYDPEGQVVRSTQSITEDNVERDATTNQDVSVANNLPGLGDDFGSGDEPSMESNRTEEVTNFEISKTIRNTVRESGEVQKLSVAVLVDGRYTTDEEGNKTYQPRSQEELDKITALVKSAVGFDEDRGDVIEVANMQFTDMELDFTTEEELIFGFEKTRILDSAEMMMLIVMGILIILLVLRPLVSSLVISQKTAMELAREEAALLAQETAPAALTGPSSGGDSKGGGRKGSAGGDGGDSFGEDHEEEESLIDMQTVEGKVKASSVRKVGEIVNSHPNETVAVLRNWMTQD